MSHAYVYLELRGTLRYGLTTSRSAPARRVSVASMRGSGLKHVVHSRALAWQHCGSGCTEFFLQPPRCSLTAIERGYSGCLPKRTLLVLEGGGGGCGTGAAAFTAKQPALIDQHIAARVAASADPFPTTSSTGDPPPSSAPSGKFSSVRSFFSRCRVAWETAVLRRTPGAPGLWLAAEHRVAVCGRAGAWSQT